MNRKILATLLFAFALAVPPLTLAENDHDHGDHGDHHGHDGHGGHHADNADGAWSYLERDNPEPYRAEERYQMVPVPGFGHMYVTAERVDKDTRCEALLEASHVMVDRETREACGETASAEHEDHGDHNDRHGHDHH